MRLFLVAALICGTSCSRSAAPATVAPTVDTTLVFIADSSMKGGNFPQVSDSTRIQPDGSVRAARDAPLCSLDLNSIVSGWEEVSTPIETRYFRALALRLPPGFRPSWHSRPRDPNEDDPEETNAGTDYWGHMLGSWEASDEGGFDMRSPHFTLWIGAHAGYPTSSIAGAEVTQVGFSECRVETPLGLVPVARFEVQSPSPKLGGFEVIAYAEIQPGVYIQAMGSGPDAASQSLLFASIASMRIIR